LLCVQKVLDRNNDYKITKDEFIASVAADPEEDEYSQDGDFD